MHPQEQSILDAFSKTHQSNLSTSYLAEVAFPSEFSSIKVNLSSPNQDLVRSAKRTKSMLHRKLLYHLSKLTDQGLIKVSSIKERGEKVYSLALEAGELVVSDKNKTVAITKHQEPESFVNYWVEKGVLVQLTKQLHKFEAYALNAQAYPGIHHLRQDLSHIYAHLQDVLAIVNFEDFLKQDSATLKEGLTELVADTKDYGVSICLHIDISNRPLDGSSLSFFESFASLDAKRIYVVLSGSYAAIRDQQNMLSKISSILSRNRIKLNIQNTDRKPLTHIMGYSGIYSLTKDQLLALKKSKGVAVCNTSYTLDLGRCSDLTSAEIRNLCLDAAKSMLARTTLQRRIGSSIFSGLSSIGNIKDQIANVECYLRVWNYDLQGQPISDLLSSVQRELVSFCNLENIIFAACGVPVNFNVALAPAFIHYGSLSKRRYKKSHVYDRSSLKSKELEKRELIGSSFSSDRVRIFRSGSYSPQELLAEFLYLFYNFDFGFITYEFRQLQKTIPLTKFI